MHAGCSLSLEEIQQTLMTCVLLVRNLLLFIPMILRNIQLEVNCFNSLILLCVNEKQGDESHEPFMHQLIQERNLISLFPNIAIILLICLCLMCSNSSGEKSFSKLKQIKNELRSPVSQQRLHCLSLMGNESELLRNQNFDKLIHEFACRKARKVLLYFECLTWWEKLNIFAFLSL